MEREKKINRARDLMALHCRAGGFILPNAWDAMSARLFEAAGFRAVGTTSGGVNWSLGYQDGEGPPWSDVVAATARIARAVRVPVSADIEAGYAKTPDELQRNVAEIISAGVSGINIEDHIAGKLRLLDDACARVNAAREAADRAGIPIVINARTDVFHVAMEAEQRFDEAVKRAAAYLESGASTIFLFGLSDLAIIARLANAISAPVNVVGRPGGPSLAEYATAGVARVSIAAGMSLFAYGAVRDTAKKLQETGSFDVFKVSFSRAEAQALVAESRQD
jgi:2-methylisocitrate lyase-like PEP mutase family enzyme